MVRRVVPRKSRSKSNVNEVAPLTVTIVFLDKSRVPCTWDGQPVDEVQEVRFEAETDSGRPKRVRVFGGLPCVYFPPVEGAIGYGPSCDCIAPTLDGERMTAEQRQAHDDYQYACIFGSPGKLGKGSES